MITASKNAQARIAPRSTLCGEFVEIEFPFSFLDPEEALELAQRLTLSAHIVSERRKAPATRSLPLSEAFSLETVGASAVETHQG